jgi:hypothetical protein
MHMHLITFHIDYLISCDIRVMYLRLLVCLVFCRATSFSSQENELVNILPEVFASWWSRLPGQPLGLAFGSSGRYRPGLRAGTSVKVAVTIWADIRVRGCCDQSLTPQHSESLEPSELNHLRCWRVEIGADTKSDLSPPV